MHLSPSWPGQGEGLGPSLRLLGLTTHQCTTHPSHGTLSMIYAAFGGAKQSLKKRVPIILDPLVSPARLSWLMEKEQPQEDVSKRGGP